MVVGAVALAKHFPIFFVGPCGIVQPVRGIEVSFPGYSDFLHLSKQQYVLGFVLVFSEEY
jgi:hypothetical protein